MEAGILDDTAAAPRDADACREVCPQLIRDALSLIGTKWAPPLLLALSAARGPIGFAELKRQMEGITAKELSRHLKGLAQAGAITRTVHPTVPPRVDYALTELGARLVGPIEHLADCGARLRTRKSGGG